jgi:UDP-N-acetyl-D-glucosamine dehydrogenase
MSEKNSYKKIAVIGLGYVGLPLSIRFCESGLDVVGLDVDPEKIDSINTGKSYIKHIDSSQIESLVSAGNLIASTQFAEIRSCEAVLICVPTPLGKHREPDISYVLETGKSIAPYLKAGEDGSKKLVVLESTTFPGTTDEDLRNILESTSGLKAGEDFHLAYSPEREDPGRTDHSVKSIPKVMGGFTSQCLQRCIELYSLALDKVHPVSSTKVAEATKLTENIFRCVNIALVNELKVVYEKMGINGWEVIEAASTKPFGFMPFYPGPGLGGHCIPIDPFYLTWKAHEAGVKTRFIELAGEVNQSMPEYVVHIVSKALNGVEKSIRSSRILILGLAYKSNVDDTRESPSFKLIELLAEEGAKIDFFDPHVDAIPKIRKYPELWKKKSVKWDEETIRSFDLVLVSTAHDFVNYQELGQWAEIIVDTRNAMSEVTSATAKIYPA